MSAIGYIPNTKEGERFEYELPDGRQAPELWLRMICRKCQEVFNVNVYLGVPTHMECLKTYSPPWPILEPQIILAWHEKKQKKAVLAT